MALLGPTRLLISKKSDTYTIKWSCTIIWQVRVLAPPPISLTYTYFLHPSFSLCFLLHSIIFVFFQETSFLLLLAHLIPLYPHPFPYFFFLRSILQTLPGVKPQCKGRMVCCNCYRGQEILTQLNLHFPLLFTLLDLEKITTTTTTT